MSTILERIKAQRLSREEARAAFHLPRKDRDAVERPEAAAPETGSVHPEADPSPGKAPPAEKSSPAKSSESGDFSSALDRIRQEILETVSKELVKLGAIEAPAPRAEEPPPPPALVEPTAADAPEAAPAIPEALAAALGESLEGGDETQLDTDLDLRIDAPSAAHHSASARGAASRGKGEAAQPKEPPAGAAEATGAQGKKDRSGRSPEEGAAPGPIAGKKRREKSPARKRSEGRERPAREAAIEDLASQDTSSIESDLAPRASASSGAHSHSPGHASVPAALPAHGEAAQEAAPEAAQAATRTAATRTAATRTATARTAAARTAAAAGLPGEALPAIISTLEKFHASLVPGIADGISQAVVDLERGQERLTQAIEALSRRLASLEARLGSSSAAPPAAGGGGGVTDLLRGLEDRLAKRLENLAGLVSLERHT